MKQKLRLAAVKKKKAKTHYNVTEQDAEQATEDAADLVAEQCNGSHGLDPEVKNLLNWCGVVTTVLPDGSLEMKQQGPVGFPAMGDD
jgi:hypothetical protein